jgi:hypothetical protein
MSTKDGGPMFPIATIVNGNGDVQPGWNGASLRDWFAGQALAALMADPNSPVLAVDIARYAWEQADAMLAQREKQP